MDAYEDEFPLPDEDVSGGETLSAEAAAPAVANGSSASRHVPSAQGKLDIRHGMWASMDSRIWEW